MTGPKTRWVLVDTAIIHENESEDPVWWNKAQVFYSEEHLMKYIRKNVLYFEDFFIMRIPECVDFEVKMGLVPIADDSSHQINAVFKRAGVEEAEESTNETNRR